MVSAGWLTVHVAGMLVLHAPGPCVRGAGEVQVRPALFLPEGGGEGEVQVMSSRWVVNSAEGINTWPLHLELFLCQKVLQFLQGSVIQSVMTRGRPNLRVTEVQAFSA